MFNNFKRIPQDAKRVFVRRHGVHHMHALASLSQHKIVVIIIIIIIVHQHNILLSACVCQRVGG